MRDREEYDEDDYDEDDRPRRGGVHARNIGPALELKVPLPINAASPQDFAATRRGRTP